MKVTELNREQLTTLKQDYLIRLVNDGVREEPSWEEMSRVDELVKDEVIFEKYEGIEFVEEDFV